MPVTEQETYRRGRALLVTDPRAGVAALHEALHDWRGAPVELLPDLLRLLDLPELRADVLDAVSTARLSAEACRVHAGLLAAAGHPPGPVRYGRRRRIGPVHSPESATALLAARPVGLTRLGPAPEIFGALLDAGPLTFRQAAQLYNLTFRWPNATQARCAPLWFRHAGPSSLPRLLALLTRRLHDQAVGEDFLDALAALGPHARPALPAVLRIVDRPDRIPSNDPTRYGETLIDETLLAAALRARDAITGETCSLKLLDLDQG